MRGASEAVLRRVNGEWLAPLDRNGKVKKFKTLKEAQEFCDLRHIHYHSILYHVTHNEGGHERKTHV